jgi:hypothetical protein
VPKVAVAGTKIFALFPQVPPPAVPVIEPRSYISSASAKLPLLFQSKKTLMCCVNAPAIYIANSMLYVAPLVTLVDCAM